METYAYKIGDVAEYQGHRPHIRKDVIIRGFTTSNSGHPLLVVEMIEPTDEMIKIAKEDDNKDVTRWRILPEYIRGAPRRRVPEELFEL